MRGTDIKILLCDDERCFCKSFAHSLICWFHDHGINIECKCFSDSRQVLEDQFCSEAKLAFLDVEMPQLNGIELGKKLKEKNPNLVIIYISTFLEFAVDGYKVDAFRYLLKNDYERTLPECLHAALKMLVPEDQYFTFTKDEEQFRIPFGSIYFMESKLRKVYIYGDDPQNSINSFYSKIATLTPKLEHDGFLRIGQSFLVNMSHIAKMSNYTVLLDNGVVLNTTRRGFSDLQQKYLSWKGRF